MTLQQLNASLRRAVKAARHHALAARRSRKLAARRRKQIKAVSTGRDTAIRRALSFVGIHESPAGSNKGPHITDWQVQSGYSWVKSAAQGVSWCQCFANAIAKIGGAVLIPDGYTPDFLSGKYADRGYKRIRLNDAKPGDFVYYKFPGVSNAICDHVGVLHSRGYSTVETIEGNTSPASGSQNNGGGVYLKTRNQSLIAGVVRVPYPE